MKLKPKGRRIYRQKSRSERMRAARHKVGAVLLTVVGAGVLVFVGYSAGAPVLRFLQEEKILPTPGAQTSETTPPPTETAPVSAETMHGYALPVTALYTTDALQEALDAMPPGTTHVLLPLKVQGGSLYYATSLEDARRTGAVQAAMPLRSICDAVTAKGVKPAAVLNALEDSCYSRSFPASAYCMNDGTLWLEDGSTPWLSPYSPLALDYLSNLAAEAASAGIPVIVVDGLRFPAFTEAESTVLAPTDRTEALGSVIDAMQQAAPDAAWYVRLSPADTEALAAAESRTLAGILVCGGTGTALSQTHPCYPEGETVPEGAESYVLDAAEPTEPATETPPTDTTAPDATGS